MNVNKKSLTKEIKELLGFILPKGKQEILLFLGFLLLYLSYSQYIARNTFIFDFPYFLHPIRKTIIYLYDGYFTYDTIDYYHKGFQNIFGHPMLIFFYKPFAVIGSLLVDVFQSGKAKTLFLIFCMASVVSMSVVYVQRYLRMVVELKGAMKWLLTIFYGTFSTTLILSFTFESFPVSLFLLTMSVCFYSLYMKRKEEVGFLSSAFFALTLGGITITNFAKGIVPVLFSTKNIKQLFIRISILGIVFLGAILWNTVYYDHLDMVGDLTHSVSTYAGSTKFSESVIDRLVDSFFASPIFMSGLKVGTLMMEDRSHAIIQFDVYRHWWQYAFAIPLLLLLTCAVIKNYKNKFVWLLLALFSIDIAIHLIAGYGILEGFFIYGAHWVYIVPLLLGWLYKSLRMNQKKVMLGAMSILLTILIVNNAIQMAEFIELAVEHFSTTEWDMFEKIGE